MARHGMCNAICGDDFLLYCSLFLEIDGRALLSDTDPSREGRFIVIHNLGS